MTSSPEKLTGGRYLDIAVDREACARVGLNTGDVQSMIEMLVGGMPVTTTVEGRAALQRAAALRRGLPRYRRRRSVTALIETPHQGPIPLKQVATIALQVRSQSMIAAENGLLRSVVFANVRDRAMVETVQDLTAALDKGLELPKGYYFRIAGQWENIERARRAPAADHADRAADHLRLPLLHV